MTKYRITYENGEWLVLMHCSDGMDDVLAACDTKSDAKRELQNIIDEQNAADGAERHYQAQYAYACGYHD